MELRHYAAASVELDRDRESTQRTLSSYAKPRGFWVSVKGEDDWPSWCRAEEFAADRLTTEHEVVINSDANILALTTPDQLDTFTTKYGVRETRSYGGGNWVDVAVDWTRVVDEFDGIIIAPYQWRQRLELDWYYGWDCASGCIWNLSAIESVTPVVVSAVR